MADRMTPEREAYIRDGLNGRGFPFGYTWVDAGNDMLTEIKALRAERDALASLIEIRVEPAFAAIKDCVENSSDDARILAMCGRIATTALTHILAADLEPIIEEMRATQSEVQDG